MHYIHYYIINIQLPLPDVCCLPHGSASVTAVKLVQVSLPTFQVHPKLSSEREMLQWSRGKGIYFPSVSLGLNLEVSYHHSWCFHKFSLKFLFLYTSHCGNVYARTVGCRMFFTSCECTALLSKPFSMCKVLLLNRQKTHFNFS